MPKNALAAVRVSGFIFVISLVAKTAIAANGERDPRVWRPRGGSCLSLFWSSRLQAEPADNLRIAREHGRFLYDRAVSRIQQSESDLLRSKLVTEAFLAQEHLVTAHNKLKAQGLEKYEIVPIRRFYLDQDLTSEKRVRYLTSAEAEKLKLRNVDGFLAIADGTVLKNNSFDYVMDPDGNIFISPFASKEVRVATDLKAVRLRHSSMLAGRPVAASGGIAFDANGRITLIDDESGHYAPGPVLLDQFISRLRELGIDLSAAQIVRRY